LADFWTRDIAGGGRKICEGGHALSNAIQFFLVDRQTGQVKRFTLILQFALGLDESAKVGITMSVRTTHGIQVEWARNGAVLVPG